MSERDSLSKIRVESPVLARGSGNKPARDSHGHGLLSVPDFATDRAKSPRILGTKRWKAARDRSKACPRIGVSSPAIPR